jgi:hypothetical protein
LLHVAHPGCGWCHNSISGSCHNGTYAEACNKTGALWLGPTSEQLPQSVSHLVESAIHQHLKTKVIEIPADGSAIILWKIPNFQELYGFVSDSPVASPMFSSKGAVWRITSKFSRKGPRWERPIGFYLQLLYHPDPQFKLETNFSMVLRHLYDPQRSVVKSKFRFVTNSR